MRNIIFVQPALPKYRLDFFRRLSAEYGDRLKVYYSSSSLLKSLEVSELPDWAIELNSIYMFPGPAHLEWQPNVIKLKIKKGDILVLSGNPRQISTIALLLKAKLKGVTIVWWGQYWSSTSKRWRQMLRFIPMSLSNALLFYTDVEVESFKNDKLALGKKSIIKALNNGINITEIKQLKMKYIATHRDPSLLFIGRLTEKSKLHLAFEAIAKLGSDAPTLHIVGDGIEKESLERLAEKLDITKYICWHGVITDEVEISRIANICKAFLYPGEVGLSLIHAMAYGLPAIIHNDNSKHMPEIAAFTDGLTGTDFKMDDVDSLCQSLRFILNNDQKLNNYSKKSYSTIESNFTTERMAERFTCLISELISDDNG